MVNKSNEYGFVPSSPTQARGSNTGIFEVNDVVDLLTAGQWTLQDRWALIETKTFSGVSSVEFTNLQESIYKTHILVNHYFSQDYIDNYGARWLLSTDGGSNYIQSGYAMAYQQVQQGTGFVNNYNNSRTHFQFMGNVERISNESGARSVGIHYIYNLGNANQYTHYMANSYNLETADSSYIGGGFYNTTGIINAMKFDDYGLGYNIEGKFSLYGLVNT